ncbi:MAG TPA: MFS transporter [Candidatus Baltobacteraceae bacterium]|nr:MFS transporter [Candidatus Baltobacteraceae bacterium]
MLASLRRHRNYRLYFAGQFVSQIGTWLQTAAQAWLILQLTHSAEAVGVLGFFFYGPYAVFGLIGGALADRHDRRVTLLVGQVAMAICALLLALAVFFHFATVWFIDSVALVRGTILVFNNPSRQALMVQLVGRSELGNAIALNSSLNNATRIIGPALAGVLIESTGLGMCFLLNAISFVPVIWAIAAMRVGEFHPQADVRRSGALLDSIRIGLRYARHTKTVAIVLAMMFAVSFLAINFNVLLPVLAQQTMHGGPQTYGWIAAVFGLGALIGALIAASRARASRARLLVACAAFGAGQCILAAQHTFLAVSLALLVTGIAYTMYTATTNAFVQLATPGFLQGRVGGLYNYVFLASGPIGSLLAGWLCERGGTALAFAVGGTATLIMTVAGVVSAPWPMPTGTVRPRRSAG